MQRICILLFMFLFSLEVLGQPQANNWYFGEYIGLNFRNTTPTILRDGKMNTTEGVATISDKKGKLLFYTDGVTIWNRLHEVMKNGTGLMGSYTSSQSGIIVPQPGNDSIYFVFTVDFQAHENGLRYSILNLRGAGGLGEIQQKNIPLRTPVCEKISAVRHCNERDYWVVSHDWDSDQYIAYLVSPVGVTTIPVVSSTGINVSGSVFATLGLLKFSPDGKKLAAAHYALGFTELSSFNTQNGIVSNSIKIPSKPLNAVFSAPVKPYGVEFSMDGKLLYESSGVYFADLATPDYSYLHQYDISIHDSAQIESSRVQVSFVPNDNYSALQMANNGKIYLTTSTRMYLSAINDPSVKGIGCDFQKLAVDLTPNYTKLGLPNFIQSYFYEPFDFSIASSTNCLSLTRDFQFSNSSLYDSVKWFFGDPASGNNNISALLNPQHLFSETGIYRVQLIVYTPNPCNPTDTVFKDLWVGQVGNFLGKDSTICVNDSLVLEAAAPKGSSFQWNTGANSDNITIKDRGAYWVLVSNGSCEFHDTINISVQPLPIFSLGPDSFVCSGRSIVLAPLTTVPSTTYLWSDGSSAPNRIINTSGNYWLTLKDQKGCLFADTISIASRITPLFSLGADTTICEGASLLLGVNLPSASYYWNTGASTSSLLIQTPGTYWLTITDSGCSSTDSVSVLSKPKPNINLGADTILCDKAEIILTAGNPGGQYIWSNGSTQQQIKVQAKGNYSVRVILNGCGSTDDIYIDNLRTPKFSLGPDQPICVGIPIILDPIIRDVDFKWQNGSSNPLFSVTDPGLYFVQASNFCGSQSDSITVYKGPCKLIMPNAFTPNGDGKNDVFRVGFGENTIEFSMKIYNRWGQLVFTSNNRSKGWDGRINGSIGSVGTYVWMIEYKTIDGVKGILNGTVMLIR